MTEEKEQSFDHWAILELMGHRRLAGRVTEAKVAGGTMLRIDIPRKEGETTQFYSVAAVYCITPTSEEIARAVAARVPQPVHAWEWELRHPALPAAADHDLDDQDDDL